MTRDFIFMHHVAEVEIEDKGRDAFVCVVGRTSKKMLEGHQS